MPSLLKRIKRRVRDAVRDAKTFFELRNLSPEDAFDTIYQNGLWGDNEGWSFYSGNGSHSEKIIRPYIQAVDGFLSAHKDIETIVDLGCGDFNVGQNFCGSAKRYIAVDVSSLIIRENLKRFAEHPVEFLHLDILREELPCADVAVIRQVLQHLPNEDIDLFLQNISGKYRYLLVTESLCKSWRFRANRNIVSGPHIRFNKRSGVVLTSPPFNLRPKSERPLCEVVNGREFISTILYEF